MRLFKKLIILTIAILFLATAGLFAYSYQQINNIPKFIYSKSEKNVNLNNNINLPDQSLFLLFSTGSNGLTKEDGIRLGIGKYRAGMADNLTDTIMLIMVNNKTKKIGILSINRDMYMANIGSRINSAYSSGGISKFLEEIKLLTGLEPEHQININFMAFADIADSLGGVDMYIPTKVYDKYSFLNITNPGCVHFDGATALAFARSRHWATMDSKGNYKIDNTSTDYGRIERQQALIRAFLKKSLNPSIITKIPSILAAASKSMTLDPGLTTGKLLSLGSAFSGGVNNFYASTTPNKGVMLNGASVTLPLQDQIFQTIYDIADKIGYILPSDWSGRSYVKTSDKNLALPGYSNESSTVTNSNIAELDINNGRSLIGSNDSIPDSTLLKNLQTFKPDHGAGNGGLTFATCTNGHLPNS